MGEGGVPDQERNKTNRQKNCSDQKKNAETENSGDEPSAEEVKGEEDVPGNKIIQEKDESNKDEQKELNKRENDEGRGDEFEGDDDDDLTDENDEEEEEEEEPLFKYQRIEGQIDRVFQKDDASAITTSTKFLAIGTHSGMLQIYTHSGNFVNRFRPHSATIHDVKIEVSEQFVCTASMDGKVSILPISGNNDIHILDLKRPMRSIALEPLYHKHLNKRQFVTGGLAGNLTLHEKGWLGNRETILHSGEGPVWRIEWKNNFIAWTNDTGIRVLDINTHQKIAHILRGNDEPRADLYPCYIYWENPNKILVGWADTIRVISVKEKINTSIVSFKVEEIFQVDCIISGICFWEAEGSDDIAILAHTTESEDSENQSHDEASYSPERRTNFSKRKPAQRPELRIISQSGEETSSDALSIDSFQRYQPSDYSLCLLPPPKLGKAGAGVGNSLYVMSPRDLILVELRNRSDHISWMIEHRDYLGAMREVEEAGLAGAQGYSLSEIGKKYLDHLVSQGKFEVAAEASPAILANDSKSWEDWIFMLAEKGQLEVIIPYVPTETPRLSKLVYEVILVHLLRKNPKEMLRVIRKWSPGLFNLPAVISATFDRLSRDESNSEILMTCLSELYLKNHQPGKALNYFLRLRKPEVFDLIKDHNLFTDVQDQALLLIEFDDELSRKRDSDIKETSNSETSDLIMKQSSQVAGSSATRRNHGTAINLLVEHTYSIPVSRVIDQLVDHRRYLYMYLDKLFEFDQLLASDYGDLHVDLFAEFDRKRLMEFLRASTTYNLEKAYKICQSLDFVSEMVYLLGRMGNNRKALFLIIDRIGDVQRAIEFAKEQNDHDLWEDLLLYSESRPAFIRGLLDTVGSEIDPIRLIRRIQNGLEIPGLKASIIKILQDFNLQISLIEGCRSVLISDCRELSNSYYSGQTSGALGDPSLRCQKCQKLLSEPSGSSKSLDQETETVTGTVVDPEESQIEKIGSLLSIMFLCRHSFHSLCVFDSTTVLSAISEQNLHRSKGNLSRSGEAILGGGGNIQGFERFNSINLKFNQTLILKSGNGSCPICTPVSK